MIDGGGQVLASGCYPALADALRDEDAFVRRDAAAALGKIGAGAAPAVPALLTAMRDRNAGVRQEATWAVRGIDPAAADRAGLPPRDDSRQGH